MGFSRNLRMTRPLGTWSIYTRWFTSRLSWERGVKFFCKICSTGSLLGGYIPWIIPLHCHHRPSVPIAITFSPIKRDKASHHQLCSSATLRRQEPYVSLWCHPHVVFMLVFFPLSPDCFKFRRQSLHCSNVKTHYIPSFALQSVRGTCIIALADSGYGKILQFANWGVEGRGKVREMMTVGTPCRIQDMFFLSYRDQHIFKKIIIWQSVLRMWRTSPQRGMSWYRRWGLRCDARRWVCVCARRAQQQKNDTKKDERTGQGPGRRVRRLSLFRLM